MTELVAVIAAAIAAAEGTTTDGFVVRSIREEKKKDRCELIRRIKDEKLYNHSKRNSI